MAKAIMIQGTMSNSGKSFITAGLCRVFMQDGYKTAPFKSQNMALNSYITKDGLEIGRAQAMQAEAAGIDPVVEMNPILLKPNSDMGSQVIVNGEVRGNQDAMDYYKDKKKLIPDVMKAYNTLNDKYDIIVIEGAGSPAEINLHDNDIVNMGMAKMAKAPVLLAGDIDRGGVFASLYGTVSLLDTAEQEYIKGFIINKFRGDVEILKPGLTMIEEKTNIPVVGVIPMERLDLDDEDSLSDRLDKNLGGEKVDIAVIRLPHLSNFTDFGAFERMPGVSLRYVKSAIELGNPDLIILPGTKNTMDDCEWLRKEGLDRMILCQREKNTPIIGICGGYQLLGEEMEDPDFVEHGGSMKALGLLSTKTVFASQKTRDQIKGTVIRGDGLLKNMDNKEVTGYEIHMGVTTMLDEKKCKSLIVLEDGRIDAIGNEDGSVFGSYLHGLFDTPGMAEHIVKLLMERKGFKAQEYSFNLAEYKEQEYDKLADLVRKSLDMEQIYKILWEGI